MFPTIEDINKEFKEKRISLRKSNDEKYLIANYTKDTEFKKLWNDTNIWCRGLIFDVESQEIVGLPFKKFFNLNQISDCTFDKIIQKGNPKWITEKLDGSLGIAFWCKYENKIRVATRGSLDSIQSKWATNWINKNATQEYKDYLKNNKTTHLYEIIFNENRIVVKYDFNELVFIASIDNKSYKIDYDDKNIPNSFKRAKHYNNLTLEQLIQNSKTLQGNEEGWVVIYDDQTMIKIKGEEYKRLHALKGDVTPKRILDIISNYSLKDRETLLSLLPDEFYDEVNEYINELEIDFKSRKKIILEVFNNSKKLDNQDRKTLAIFGQKNLDNDIINPYYALLNNEEHKVDKLIWNSIKPKNKFEKTINEME